MNSKDPERTFTKRHRKVLHLHQLLVAALMRLNSALLLKIITPRRPRKKVTRNVPTKRTTMTGTMTASPLTRTERNGGKTKKVFGGTEKRAGKTGRSGKIEPAVSLLTGERFVSEQRT